MTRLRVSSLALLTFAGLLACKSEQASTGGAQAQGETPPANDKTAELTPPTDTAAGDATPPASDPATDDAKPAEPESEAPAPELAPEPLRFWVAQAQLTAYDLDGKQVGSLKVTGDQVRRLADGRFIAYQEQAEQDQLLVFAADGKQQRSIALPTGYDASDCSMLLPKPPGSQPEVGTGTGTGSETGGDDDDWGGDGPLRPQDASAVAVDKAGGHVCLGLQDRNDNMADQGMLVAVDLRNGGLRYRVTWDSNDTCSDKGDLGAKVCNDRSAGEPWIEGTPPVVPAQTWAYAFDEKTISIRKGQGAATTLCAAGVDPSPDAWGSCASLESTSPSGRWQLFSGLVSEGDYIHRELLLLDRSDGKLWQILEGEQGPRFAAVTVAQVFDESDGEVLSVVGESEIGWLPNDRLWIDGRLLIPESRTIVTIGGTRVRTL